MRVYLRKNVIYLQWWDGEQNQRKSLKIKYDGDTSKPDWWKRTKFAAQIRREIATVEKKNLAIELGVKEPQIERAIDLFDLLADYNEANEEQRGKKSHKTLLHRESAVKFFLKYLPHGTSRELTNKSLLKLRRLADNDGYSPASTKGYFRELASLARFGFKRGVSPEEYPAEEIYIRIPHEEPQPTPIDEEQKFFRHIWSADNALFCQLFFLRLTGVRREYSCQFTWDQVLLKDRLWYYQNSKAHRSAPIMMQHVLHELFEYMHTKDSGFVFAYRDGATLHHYAKRHCDALGIPNINPHKLKANYLFELDGLDISDRLLTIAAHHSPQGPGTIVARHYSRNRSALLAALEAAQQGQLEFFRKLIFGDKS